MCAFPQRTILIDYLPPGGVGRRLFAHTLADDSVIHTVDGATHAFVLVPSEEALVDQLAAACQWSNTTAPAQQELTVGRDAFTRACDAAAAGSDAEARQILDGTAGAGEGAGALAAVLASGPRISIVQMLQPYATPALQDQSFTVIDNGKQAWMVAPLTNASDAPLRARTVSRADIGTTLLRGL